MREWLEEIWDSIPTWAVVAVFVAIVIVAALGAFVFRWYPGWVFFVGLGALVLGGIVSAIRQAA
jgi:hypothetical protein